MFTMYKGPFVGIRVVWQAADCILVAHIEIDMQHVLNAFSEVFIAL